MSRSRGLGVAAAAASIATVGDFLLLFVGNSLRPELQLPSPPSFVLPLGGVLGVAAIPLYSLGYGSIAGEIRPVSPVLSLGVLISGTGAAVLGSVIHGLTAFSIRASVLSGGSGLSPVATVTASGAALISLWLVASALVLVASAAVFSATTDRHRCLPRRFSWLNPAVLTVLLAGTGLPWEVGRSFLLPAAPNLAHAIFFGALVFGLRRGDVGEADGSAALSGGGAPQATLGDRRALPASPTRRTGMDLRTSGEISTMDLAKIQAQVLIPLARALRKEVGEARAHELLRGAIAEAHRGRVADEADQLEGTPLEKFQAMMNRSAAVNGPQLEFEVLEMNPETIRFDVRGCRYAQLFQALGETELGAMLLCDGDAYVAEVGGDAVEFTRTQTLMSGGTHCDFCYQIRPGRAGDGARG